MRSRRVILYASGWAALTLLAAFAVWWGLRPLLASGFTPSPPASPSISVSPSASVSLSPSPSATPSKKTTPASPTPSVTPTPKPSMYEGWAYANGAFTQTFNVTGGTATVRIVDGKVELVSSAPRDGYTITPLQNEPQRLVLQFLKPGGTFTTVDCMWWEGRPYAQVTTS